MNLEIEANVIEAVQNYFAQVRHQSPPNTLLYQLSQDIDPRHVFQSHERFGLTFEKGILNRPDIVNDMKDILSANSAAAGLFVTGPQGIGKSHSLVNLVHSLRADGHLVTFIPDCEGWETNEDLFIASCRSLGVTREELGFNKFDVISDASLRFFLEVITEAIQGVQGKKWFLVFDQVNRIFARAENMKTKDVGALKFPFTLMKQLGRENVVQTIISASANNDLLHRFNHDGFVKYEHPIVMTKLEIKAWKGDNTFSDEQLETILATTGNCPLEFSELLSMEKKDNGEYDTSKYEEERSNIVKLSMNKLVFEHLWSDDIKNEIVQRAVDCLTGKSIGSEPNYYDKKFSVFRDGSLKPLFPAVLIAYREMFWKQLVEYVSKNEDTLLRVCDDQRVTEDVRGRLFELIVITRFMHCNKFAMPKQTTRPSRSLSKQTTVVNIKEKVSFSSQELPKPSSEGTLVIPKNPNFPAIDFFFKETGKLKVVWAIQVHVAEHKNVLPTFRTMCEARGWLNHFDKIYLVYLAPSVGTIQKSLYKENTATDVRTSKRQKKQTPIEVLAYAKDAFDCLESIAWKTRV